MYPLTERCRILRDRAENTGETNRDICFQRDFYFRKGCAKAAGLSNDEILASGISTVAREARVVIRGGELLVGYNFADSKYEWW